MLFRSGKARTRGDGLTDGRADRDKAVDELGNNRQKQRDATDSENRARTCNRQRGQRQTDNENKDEQTTTEKENTTANNDTEPHDYHTILRPCRS